MPIPAKCPGCGTEYLLVDEQRGLRVRCRNCVDTFIVGAEVTATAPAALPPSPPSPATPVPAAPPAATITPPAVRETVTPEAALTSLPSPPEGEGSGVRGTQEQGRSTMGPAASAPRTLPEQFGRYRIVKKLGAGGMGTVYLAHDSQLDRPVALKVPHFSPRDAQVRHRFDHEAKAAATLAHPNLCPVYDVGEIDGILYLTMAYIEGKPLSAFLRGGKALPQRGAALLVYKIAGALQEAHQKGVIHRDLKPANVMINQRREPVVMDFGLARRSASDVRVTRSGLIIGTPAYMPPEQVTGDNKAIGPASDVYSLGVILYEMLTGKLPFDGPVAAVLGQIMVQQPEPPSRHAPDCDPALEAICLKAMAKKVGDRYASMSEFREALGAYLRDSPPPVAPAPTPPAEVSWWTPGPSPEGGSSHEHSGTPAFVEPLPSVSGSTAAAAPVPPPVAQASSWKESPPPVRGTTQENPGEPRSPVRDSTPPAVPAPPDVSLPPLYVAVETPAAHESSRPPPIPLSKTILAPPEQPIRYQCPRCGKSLEAPANMGGQKVNCPGCGQRLQVPHPALPPPLATALPMLDARSGPPIRVPAEDESDERDSRRRNRGEVVTRVAPVGRGGDGAGNRSGVVTAAGVLTIIFGSLNLLCGFADLFLASVATDLVGKGVGKGNDLLAVGILQGLIGLTMSGTGISGGIGVLQRQRWGRILTFVTVGLDCLSLVLSLIALASLRDLVSSLPPSLTLWVLFDMVIRVGFAVFALVVLTNPNLTEDFR